MKNDHGRSRPNIRCGKIDFDVFQKNDYFICLEWEFSFLKWEFLFHTIQILNYFCCAKILKCISSIFIFIFRADWFSWLSWGNSVGKNVKIVKIYFVDSTHYWLFEKPSKTYFSTGKHLGVSFHDLFSILSVQYSLRRLAHRGILWAFFQNVRTFAPSLIT